MLAILENTTICHDSKVATNSWNNLHKQKLEYDWHCASDLIDLHFGWFYLWGFLVKQETPCVSLWELHKSFWPQYVVTCLVCRSLIGFWSWFKLGNLGLTTPYSRWKVPQVFCLSHLKRRNLRFVSSEGTLLLKDLIMDGSHFWCLVWEIPVRWYQDLLALSNSAVVQCLFITVLYDWWILALKCICTGCGAVTRLNSLLFCWKLRGSSSNCA